jgi:hypothetical protein
VDGLQANQMSDKNINMMGKNNSASTVDEKATALLLKTSGLLSANEPVSDELQDRFGCQFLNSMTEELVGQMRSSFGISEEGGITVLDALAIEDEA